jgi:hypothetical protein
LCPGFILDQFICFFIHSGSNSNVVSSLTSDFNLSVRTFIGVRFLGFSKSILDISLAVAELDLNDSEPVVLVVALLGVLDGTVISLMDEL